MDNLLLGLDRSLTLSTPAVGMLASRLEPAFISYLDESPSSVNGITRILICSTAQGATLVYGWLDDIRNRLSTIQSVSFVEIADEDTPTSWLLDEQGWLELPESPLLSARFSANDVHSADDFALALLDSGCHIPIPKPAAVNQTKGKEFEDFNYGETQ